jgi:hypothetical protein
VITEKLKPEIGGLIEIASSDSNANQANTGNGANLPKQERFGLRADKRIIADLSAC